MRLEPHYQKLEPEEDQEGWGRWQFVFRFFFVDYILCLLIDLLIKGSDINCVTFNWDLWLNFDPQILENIVTTYITIDYEIKSFLWYILKYLKF